jgi:5-hydroxyisourate hydrolase-like protein (transthyretin family)
MKPTCRAVLCLAAFLWAGTCAGAGSVQVQSIRDCTQSPRITVLRDGKPAAGITVEVFRPAVAPTEAHYRDSLSMPLTTDSKGEVALPKLSPGDVWVVASWSSGSVTVPDLQTNLYLRYFPEDPQPEDHFTMDLAPNPSHEQSVEQLARAAEQKPIAEHIEQFVGTVVDLNGGPPIRDISIEVAQLHVAGARLVRKMRTDAAGHFSALLPAGDYVAIFEGSGFQRTVNAFTIDPAAKQKEMRVALRFMIAATQ